MRDDPVVSSSLAAKHACCGTWQLGIGFGAVTLQLRMGFCSEHAQKVRPAKLVRTLCAQAAVEQLEPPVLNTRTRALAHTATMRQRTTVITRELPEDDGQPSGSGRRGLFAEVDPLLQSEGPLDECEQEKLIQDFQDIQLRQARTWRVRLQQGTDTGPACLTAAVARALPCTLGGCWECECLHADGVDERRTGTNTQCTHCTWPALDQLPGFVRHGASPWIVHS